MDADEERARVEHANRGVNTEMANILKAAVKDRQQAEAAAGVDGDAASLRFLSRKVQDKDKHVTTAPGH
jgi:hypothetical protein